MRPASSLPTYALLGFCLGVWIFTGQTRYLLMVGIAIFIVSLFLHGRAAHVLGVGVLCGIVRVAVAGPNPVSVQPDVVTTVQTWAVERIDAAVPYPASALTAGILFGLRADLPRSLVESMRTAGLSHMLAVSGFNVTIVALVLGRLIARVVGKRPRVVLTIAIVALYVVLCGAGPPVVRAGIMGGLAALVLSSGRTTEARRILLIAASLLIMWDPYIVRFDVGFQLSVAATAGLLVIGPLLQSLVKRIPNPIGMRDAATTSIAASVATLPIVIATFGVVPLYGVGANILAAPLVAPLMATGSVALIGGESTLGQLAGICTAYLARALESIAAHTTALPHASVELSGSAGWGVVGIVLGALVALVKIRAVIHKRRRERPLLL